jgi:hypothetical protein|tara:strand:+ start:2370 stop:2573 length:204 start_codon:yes stop_codon:yes gene_type:complete
VLLFPRRSSSTNLIQLLEKVNASEALFLKKFLTLGLTQKWGPHVIGHLDDDTGVWGGEGDYYLFIFI